MFLVSMLINFLVCLPQLFSKKQFSVRLAIHIFSHLPGINKFDYGGKITFLSHILEGWTDIDDIPVSCSVADVDILAVDVA